MPAVQRADLAGGFGDEVTLVVIVRQRVRAKRGPMTGSGGRSSKHGAGDFAARLCLLDAPPEFIIGPA
ncbi:MAG TPA: hypothetical protein VN803_00095, partial [Gemmatimonadales bacterium]|nr:hypothetical protein [Gemmatimonadales bacterium]